MWAVFDYYILYVLQRPPNGAPTPSGFSRQCLSPSKGDRTPAQLAEQFDAPLGHMVESAVGRGNHRNGLLGGTDEVTD